MHEVILAGRLKQAHQDELATLLGWHRFMQHENITTQKFVPRFIGFLGVTRRPDVSFDLLA